MNAEQRERLRLIMERIQSFNAESEASEYTDIGEAWELLLEAHDAIEWLFTPASVETFSDEQIAAVFWGFLAKSPGYPDRRMTAWGDKTKTGLALTIERLGKGRLPS